MAPMWGSSFIIVYKIWCRSTFPCGLSVFCHLVCVCCKTSDSWLQVCPTSCHFLCQPYQAFHWVHDTPTVYAVSQPAMSTPIVWLPVHNINFDWLATCPWPTIEEQEGFIVEQGCITLDSYMYPRGNELLLKWWRWVAGLRKFINSLVFLQ